MWIGSPLRGAFRLLSYLLVTLVLVPIYLVAMALRIQPIIRWMPVAYHRFVCIILGIKVRVHGKRSDTIPTLFVCNHVSYLDIEVLGGIIPGSFVAKAEVATWPFFSTLAKAQRTIFVERRSGKTSASRDQMMKRLNTGDNLMLFPEGTSSDGTRVLPFRSALFGVAQLRRDEKPITVQSVAIAYTRLDGIPLGRYCGRCSPGSAISIWCRTSGRWSAWARPRPWSPSSRRSTSTSWATARSSPTTASARSPRLSRRPIPAAMSCCRRPRRRRDLSAPPP